jgi:glycosyltransferase involved in cell wall biosynthesis
MKILLELRPALDGHAGIPQETRLLFRGLAQLPGVQVDGLLQSSQQRLANGLPADEAELSRWPMDKRINRLSRVVVSLQPTETMDWLMHVQRALGLTLSAAAMVAGTLLGRRQPLTRFEPAGFEDFVWRALFARTLPPEDFAAVTTARYRVARLPWTTAHVSALLMRKLATAVYPRLDTRGYDVMLAETPYPGRVSGSTRLVVRYHDAIPLLMPHTISDRSYHQASHFHALRRNVRDGAWFACVSKASRQDLLRVFPEAESRAVTIPNMVSPHYFADAGSRPTRIDEILRTRANRQVEAKAAAQGPRDGTAPLASGPSYLLMVSTLEPRKNHLGLLAAWEQLRANGNPDLQLVLVGMLGWDNKAIVAKLLPWVARGQLHVLEDVPAADLRLLYRHASATVCPSFGEGFGFSGVEAMRCGGVVAASDLPVHREVYGDAAEYFNPYSSAEMSGVLARLIGTAGQARRAELVALGAEMAARYLPDQVLPQWGTFLSAMNVEAKNS